MPLGLYIHVPFCASKCPYCDFYSLAGEEAAFDAYIDAVTRALYRWREQVPAPADTLYFGGGTPSLLGGERLAALVRTARQVFCLPDTAEITLEANPGDRLDEVFAAFAAAGGNRVSLGLQAGNDRLLHLLGRRHTVAQAEQAVRAVQAAGIRNLSLDMMLGISGQTPADVQQTAALCAAWGAAHVSAYLLKVEPGTPYATSPPPLPDEDATVALYHTAATALEAHGFAQYEISNFALPGYASRHNSKYWNLEPYIGIGPSAHSFAGGQRWAYPRSLSAFLQDCPPQPEADTPGTIAEGSPEEYAMLRLRLCEGLTEHGFAARFAQPLPAVWRQRARRLPPQLVVEDATGIRLTREGFLVSNSLLSRLLQDS